MKAIDLIKKADEKILAKAKQFTAAKQVNAKNNYKRELEAAIAEYITICSEAIKQGAFKVDPSGLLLVCAENQTSTYYEKYPIVDEIAKDILQNIGMHTENSNESSDIASAIVMNAENQSFFGKLKFGFFACMFFVWDSTKKVLTRTWNGICTAFSWTCNKVKTFAIWSKDKTVQFKDWLCSIFSKKEPQIA